VDNNLSNYHLENLGRVRQRDYVEQKKLIDKYRGHLFQTTLINQTSHLEDHYTFLESNLSTHSSVSIGGGKIKQRNIKYEPQSTGIDIILNGRTSKDEFTTLFSQKNNNVIGLDLGSAQILQRDESAIKPPMEPTFCSKQVRHKNSRDSIYPPHRVVQSGDDNGSDNRDNSTLCSTPPKQKNKKLKKPKSMARAQYETTTIWIEEDKESRRRKSKSQIKQQFETIFANVASLSDERDDNNVNISHNRGDSNNGGYDCDNGPNQKRLEKKPKKFKIEKEKEKESEEVKNNRGKGQKDKKPKKYSKLTLSQFPPLTKMTPFTNRPAMSHWRYNLLPDFCMNHRHIAKLHLTFMKKRLSFAKIYSYLEKNNLISKDYFQTINPQ
jgi:hypothetical protein